MSICSICQYSLTSSCQSMKLECIYSLKEVFRSSDMLLTERACCESVESSGTSNRCCCVTPQRIIFLCNLYYYAVRTCYIPRKIKVVFVSHRMRLLPVRDHVTVVVRQHAAQIIYSVV